MISSKTRTSRRSLVAAGERIGILDLAQRMEHRGDAALYILAYHRVDERARQPYLDPSLLSATPRQFEEQMRFLAERYHPVSAEQALAALEGGAPLPASAVLVTVDDGYRDFKEHIFPVTQRYGIRPVLFVATAFVGEGAFWWDQVYCAVQFAPNRDIETPLGRLSVATAEDKRRTQEQLRAFVRQGTREQMRQTLEQLAAVIPPEVKRREPATLTWEELRALARAGVTIAAHTHNHPILSRIAPEEARREVCDSQELVAREIEQALPIFAFPDGKADTYNGSVLDVMREEGFKMVVTMNEGRARLSHDDPLCLPRLGMSARMSLAQFHLHLTPAYSRWKRSPR